MKQAAKSLRTRSPRTAQEAKRLALVREELALEFYGSVHVALKHYGVSAAEEGRALDRLARGAATPSASGPVVQDIWQMGLLLVEWSRNLQYLDAHGRPRVLRQSGAGTTFETLANRFFPGRPLHEVLALACRCAEVVRRPSGHVALVGSIMVNMMASKEQALAFAISQIDKLLSTMKHNWERHTQGAPANRMQRATMGLIPRSKYDEFMREFRRQIYDLLLRVDSSMKRHEPKNKAELNEADAVSVGIYVSQDSDLIRAGAAFDLANITPSPVNKKSTKRKTRRPPR